MKILMAALACMLMLGACADIRLTRTNLASLRGGALGMIALDLDASSLGCDYGVLWFQRKGSNEHIFISVSNRSTGWEFAEPGSYSLYYATCENAAYKYTLSNVGAWFLPFEVKGHEIVHLGTFVPVSVAVEVDRSDVEEVTNAILTLGSSLLTNGPTRTVEFPTYEFRPANEANVEELKVLISEFANNIVYRTPVRLLSPQAMEAAYRRAYAPKPDGTAPTEQEAGTNLNIELQAAIAASREEFFRTRRQQSQPAIGPETSPATKP